MHNVLLCLHGWGGTKESFNELRTALEGSNVEVLAPDLPGFGSEPEPPRPWTTDDYADWVAEWLRRRVMVSVVEPSRRPPSCRPFDSAQGDTMVLHILGHSHGGRIAIKLVTRQCHPELVEGPLFHIFHLYLCAPAGIRHPRHFKRIAGLLLAKTGKIFLSIPGLRILQPLGRKLLYQLIRIHDYEKASPLMQQTLIEVTKEDLRPLLSHMKVPTDIFWGEDDRMTPISDAFLMQKEIPHATLHTYPGVRHRVHRERAKEIARIIRERSLVP